MEVHITISLLHMGKQAKLGRQWHKILLHLLRSCTHMPISLQVHISKQLILGITAVLCLMRTPIAWPAIRLCEVVDKLATWVQIMV
jgi:hypothetical protein